MFPTDTAWLVHQAHHRELLRIAEQQRLARAALRTQPESQSLRCKAAAWISMRLPHWFWKWQPACETQPSLTAHATVTQICN